MSSSTCWAMSALRRRPRSGPSPHRIRRTRPARTRASQRPGGCTRLLHTSIQPRQALAASPQAGDPTSPRYRSTRRFGESQPMASERNVQFSAPTWLRNLGFSSWLLVGFVLIIVGLIWLLAQTSTIVMPVILAAVLGAVAGPAVGWLERHRVPRIGGAILVLLGLVAIGVLIFCLVFGGISAHSGDISAKLNQVAGQDPGLVERRRRGQHAERQGGRAEGRARDPHDAAERGRGGHRGPQVAGVLPCLRGAQHAVRAQGRAGHAPLHRPAPGRARTGRPTSSRPTSPSRCAATSWP